MRLRSVQDRRPLEDPMNNEQLKERVRKKRFLVDALLNACAAPSEADGDAALKHAVVSHYLQAVCLELIVKTLFELDCRKEAPYTHNLTELYGQLSKDTRAAFEKSYDDARVRRRQQFNEIGDDVVFHPLADVLANNAQTVRDFKYDAMGVKSNYPADGRFYDDVFELIEREVAGIDA